jgi:TorA maturation chaperone TorD
MKAKDWNSLIQEVPADRLLDVMAVLYLKNPSEDAVKVMSGLGGDDESSDGIDRVRLEYHDLFIGSESGAYIPPYESLHRERRMQGECSAQVREVFDREGFDPAELECEAHWKLMSAPDHLGFELAFLSVLLRSAELPDAEGESLLAAARAFHDEHIATWAREYGEQLLNTAKTVTYKTLGRLTMAVAEPGFLD